MEGSDCLKKKRSEKIFLLRPSTIVAISLIADRLPSGKSLLPLGADNLKLKKFFQNHRKVIITAIRTACCVLQLKHTAKSESAALYFYFQGLIKNCSGNADC